MKDMYEVLGLRRVVEDANTPHEQLPHKVRVGLEIEVENANKVFNYENKLSPHWIMEHDGSLRNGGVELKFRKPYWGTDAITAIENMSKVCASIPELDFSRRTSVHVHVDIRELTTSQMATYLYLYMILEPLVMESLPAHRRNSEFCVPWYQTEATIMNVGKMITSLLSMGNYSPFPKQLQGDYRNFPKYSAANLATFRRFGSMEFRQLYGTGKAEDIIPWVQLWTNLRVAAEQPIDDLHDIAMALSREGPLEWLKQIIGKYVVQKLFVKLGANKIEELLYEGVRLAQYAVVLGDLRHVQQLEEPVEVVMQEPAFVQGLGAVPNDALERQREEMRWQLRAARARPPIPRGNR